MMIKNFMNEPLGILYSSISFVNKNNKDILSEKNTFIFCCAFEQALFNILKND